MADLLSNSVTGLLAFQRALAVTGHNISNANTDGYSRQRVDLKTQDPQFFGNGFLGRGVQVGGVERIRDEFVTARLQQATSEAQRLTAFHQLASPLDDLLGDTQGGLAPALQRFFNATQDVADDPTSSPARQVVLSEARNLAGRFQFLDSQLKTLNGDVNTRLANLVDEVNGLAQNIGDLNRSITAAYAQGRGQPPNDLLDQREQLINELSKLVSVRVLPQQDQAVNVFIGNGQGLVIGTQVQALALVTDTSDGTQMQVAYSNGASTASISDQLSGGTLGGTLAFRREVLGSARNELNRIAAVFADSINAQHRKGMDSKGALGSDLFSISPPQVIDNKNNTGSASISATVTDVTALQASDYRLSFDGTTFTLSRLADNTSVTGVGLLTLDGFQVTVSGVVAAGDSFLIRPAGASAGGIGVLINDPSQFAAAFPMRGEALLSNRGNSTVSQFEILDETDPDLLDTVEIRFNNPASSFDLVDVSDGAVIATGVPYSVGSNIDFNGLRVVVNGTPSAADVLRVERNLAGVSDNRNALKLDELQTRPLVGSSASFLEGYSALVGQVGSATRMSEIGAEAQERLLNDAQEARDSISGVNLDEEAANLLRFQQAYQASAQVIATADTLFQTLIGAIAR
ncbi:MAG: flagellar hook-associated protein FlgK [Gammaproteobacteria bacterium]